MTTVFNGQMNEPNYTALSSDVVGGELVLDSGQLGQPGKTVFLTDTEEWYIIRADLQLVPYTLPVSVNVSSDIEIGAVEIKNASDDTRATVDSDGLWTRNTVKEIDQAVASAVNLAPYYGEQNVASPGTGEPLLGAATYASCIMVWAKSGNVGDVYVGTSAVDHVSSQQVVLSAGGIFSIDVPLGYHVSVHQFYVDADNAGDGVQFFYMR